MGVPGGEERFHPGIGSQRVGHPVLRAYTANHQVSRIFRIVTGQDVYHWLWSGLANLKQARLG
jgi:hypothetical protein